MLKGLEYAKYDLMKNLLVELVETPLLAKHRAFIQSQEIEPSKSKNVEWTAVPRSACNNRRLHAERGNTRSVETREAWNLFKVVWIGFICLPAIAKLLKSDVGGWPIN